jgi:tetratricopeptide (TPR) repeat protein
MKDSIPWIELKVAFLFFIMASAVLLVRPVDGYVTDINELIFKGADAHYKGDLDLAIRMFEAAVRFDSSNEFAHNQLGILYTKKERYNSAYEEFSMVNEIDSHNTFAMLWLGILHLKNGELNLAFEWFNKIVEIDPNNADAYYFLGTIYNFRHNPAMAIEYLKKARDSDSEEADTHFRLAKAFHNVDMIANALFEYQRVLEIKPTYTKAINEIGWIYYNKGDKVSAINQWKRTLRINRQDRDAIFNLAKAYNEMAWEALTAGQNKTAVKYWQEALKTDPGNKASKYYLGKYGYK